MPIYTHECQECTNHFDVFCKMDERNDSHECEFCGAKNSKIVLQAPGFILKGDDWPGKNHKISGQMRKRREKLKKKADAKHREAPVATLVPNVGGERVDSWDDAQKLARDKGKNADSYAPMVRKEQAAK
jgi:putative FmdB family regulatory protein